MTQRESRSSLNSFPINPRISGIRGLSKNSIINSPSRFMNGSSSFVDFSDYFHVDQALEEKFNDNPEGVKQRISKFAEVGILDGTKNIAPRRKLAIDEITQDQLLEMAISILQKPTHIRNSNENKLLVKATEKISFFQQLVAENGPETHELCVKNMTHKYVYKNDIVFALGSVGSTFYVILKGSVSVLVNIPKNTNEDTNTGNEGNKSPELALTEIKSLSAGDSFGELALMDNKPRAATIICKENTHFAILEKIHFNKILRDNQTKKLFAQIEFFASLKIFSDWTYNSVKNLYYYTTQIETIRNQIIYKTNDETQNVYMIKKGEFKMRCILKIEQQKKESDSLASFSKTSFKKGFDLAVLGPGEIFGEEEILEDAKRTTSVTCVSNSGSLFVLSKKEFVRRVLTEEKTKEYLYEQLKVKKKWREKRIKEFINAVELSKPKEGIETRKSLLMSLPTQEKTSIGPPPQLLTSLSANIPRGSVKVADKVLVPPLELYQLNTKKVIPEHDNSGELSAGFRTDKSRKSNRECGDYCTFRSQTVEDNDENFSFQLKSVKNLQVQSDAIKEKSKELGLSSSSNFQYLQKFFSQSTNSKMSKSKTPTLENKNGLLLSQTTLLVSKSQKRSSTIKEANESKPDIELKTTTKQENPKSKFITEFQTVGIPLSLKEKIESQIKVKHQLQEADNSYYLNTTLRKTDGSNLIRNLIKNMSDNEEVNKLSAFKKISEIQKKYSKNSPDKKQNKSLQEILMSNKDKRNREYKEKRIRDYFEMKQRVITKIDSKVYKNTTFNHGFTQHKRPGENSKIQETSLPEIHKKDETSSPSFKINKSLLPLKYNVDDLRALKEGSFQKLKSSKRHKIQNSLKEITALTGTKFC